MPELPLFPLHTVLFPGMMLPLYIFEERYKRLINHCVQEKQPFGVVFEPEKKQEAVDVWGFHPVGTMAYVLDIEPLEEGRMNIMVLGRQRFRVRRLIRDVPYHVAQVDLYPLETHNLTRHAILTDRVHHLLALYLERLQESGAGEISVGHVPESPATLVYLAAILLQVPLAEKQPLLAARTYEEVLAQERRLLERENALLAYMRETQEDEGPQQETWKDGRYSPHPSRN